MFLADGEVAYFGPREEAIQYFSSIGLPCPPYYNMAGRLMTILWQCSYCDDYSFHFEFVLF